MPTMKLRSSTGIADEMDFFAAILRGLLVFFAGFLLALVARKLSSSIEESIGVPMVFFALARVDLVFFAMTDFVAGLARLPTAGFLIFEGVVGAGFLALLIIGLLVFA